MVYSAASDANNPFNAAARDRRRRERTDRRRQQREEEKQQRQREQEKHQDLGFRLRADDTDNRERVGVIDPGEAELIAKATGVLLRDDGTGQQSYQIKVQNRRETVKSAANQYGRTPATAPARRRTAEENEQYLRDLAAADDVFIRYGNRADMELAELQRSARRLYQVKTAPVAA